MRGTVARGGASSLWLHHALEIDHLEDWRFSYPTKVDTVHLECKAHHYDKTHRAGVYWDHPAADDGSLPEQCPKVGTGPDLSRPGRHRGRDHRWGASLALRRSQGS